MSVLFHFFFADCSNTFHGTLNAKLNFLQCIYNILKVWYIVTDM